VSAAADLFEAATFALSAARRGDSSAAAFLAAELIDAGLCVLALAEHESALSRDASCEAFAAAVPFEARRTAAECASFRGEPELHTPN
jgi:hypothetical protein